MFCHMDTIMTPGDTNHDWSTQMDNTKKTDYCLNHLNLQQSLVQSDTHTSGLHTSMISKYHRDNPRTAVKKILITIKKITHWI